MQERKTAYALLAEGHGKRELYLIIDDTVVLRQPCPGAGVVLFKEADRRGCTELIHLYDCRKDEL